VPAVTALERVFPSWVALVRAEPTPRPHFRRFLTAAAWRLPADPSPLAVRARWLLMIAEWETACPAYWAAALKDAQDHTVCFRISTDWMVRTYLGDLVDCFMHQALSVVLVRYSAVTTERLQTTLQVERLGIASWQPLNVRLGVRLPREDDSEGEGEVDKLDYFFMSPLELGAYDRADALVWDTRTLTTADHGHYMMGNLLPAQPVFHLVRAGIWLTAANAALPTLSQSAIRTLMRQWPTLTLAAQRKAAQVMHLDLLGALAKRPRDDDATRYGADMPARKWPRLTQ
jgi:hypothetical protein